MGKEGRPVKVNVTHGRPRKEHEVDEWADWQTRERVLVSMETSIRREFHRRHTMFDGSLTWQEYNRKQFWIDVQTSKTCIDLLERLIKVTAARTLLDKEWSTVTDQYLGAITAEELKQASEYIKQKYGLAVTRSVKVVHKDDITEAEMDLDENLQKNWSGESLGSGYEEEKAEAIAHDKKAKANAKGRRGPAIPDNPVAAEETGISLRPKNEGVAEAIPGQGLDSGIRPVEAVKVSKGQNRNRRGHDRRSKRTAGRDGVQGGRVLGRPGTEKLQGKKARGKAGPVETQGRIDLEHLPDWEGHE
jgi:hypothetical protein